MIALLAGAVTVVLVAAIYYCVKANLKESNL
jgi:Flp pilus assembly pilin Flp